jgi:mannose-1-phosphate guanylyltransferase
MNMYGVILAGGKGTRFWPYSRAARPKQFLDITGGGSMLALTYRRLARLVPESRILVFTSEELVPLVRKELPALRGKAIFAEPVGRNTAPSIAVAAALVHRMGGDTPFLVCPADHAIADEPAFRRAVRAARIFAGMREALVTFGIVPSYPATGYGYVEAGSKLEARSGVALFEAKRFHEKPGAERAASYVRARRYYWNSGMFIWRPSVFRAAWARYLPEGEAPLAAIERALGTRDLRRVVQREYPKMPAVSVDYGILEKAANVVVVPADIGWNDVGSWDSLFDLLRADSRGNTGAGGLDLVDSSNNLFFNPEGETAAIGVDNLIVVVHGRTVLVCRRGDSQRVREIIARLERERRTDLL